MGIEALIARLEEDASADIEARLAAAREEAERVVGDADRHAQEAGRAWLATREAELRADAASSLASARHQASAVRLRARSETLARVFDRARSRFGEAVGSAAYRRALPGAVARLLRYLGDGGGVLEVPPELADAVREAVTAAPAGGAVAVEASAEAAPGLVARSADGRLTVSDTLASRLEARRPALAIEVWRRLGA